LAEERASLGDRLRCIMGKHKPLRTKVKRVDVVYFEGECCICGKAIRKRHGGEWAYNPSKE
jgi:hypothetical protein